MARYSATHQAMWLLVLVAVATPLPAVLSRALQNTVPAPPSAAALAALGKNPNRFTIYFDDVYGINSQLTSDFPAPGSTAVSKTHVFLTPALTGASFGTQFFTCNILLEADEAVCTGVLILADGSSITSVAAYIEGEEDANGNEVPRANYVAITGGTGRYVGAKGQITVIENEDPVVEGLTHYIWKYELASG